ncbi:MAG: FtsQ-type POTRA domain-containing protein [Nanoarchaeota archaeon]
MTKRLKRSDRLIFLLKFTALFVLFGVIAAIMLLLNYKFFAVKNLDINLINSNCTDSKSLSDSSELLGQSILMLNEKKVEEKLKEKYLCIRKVTLAKHFPHRVEVQVFGRVGVVSLIQLDPKIATLSASFENVATPSAEELGNGKFYTVDEEGITFSESKVEGLPIIYSFGEPISPVKEVVRIIAKLKTFGLETKDGYLNQTATFMVGIYPKIIFNLSENVDVQLASLQLILEQAKIKMENLEFIDLRFDKPIVRLAPKDKIYGQR